MRDMMRTSNHNKNKYFNLLNEKRYDYNQILTREQEECGFVELSGKLTRRVICIKEILNILNIHTTTTIKTFTQEFLISKYDEVINNRKKWFDTFSLRDRMKELKGIQVRHITDTINPIFEKWCGSVLKSDGKTSKMINGKKVNITNYKIEPPLNINIIQEFKN